MDPCHCLCCITVFASVFVWNTQYARSPSCEMSATQSQRELPKISAQAQNYYKLWIAVLLFFCTLKFYVLTGT